LRTFIRHAISTLLTFILILPSLRPPDSRRYTYALHALSHALLLAPQNPFIFLQFAETAHTSGDVPLALKMYLVVIDMNDGEGADTIPEGISIRAWWGVKLVSKPFATLSQRCSRGLLQCTRRLISSSPQASLSNTPIPENLNLIDELATERILTAYSGERGAQTRSLISNWMSSMEHSAK